MNTKLHQDLLSKPLSRKQFLQVVGAGILSVIGFSAFVSNLNKFATTRNTSVKESGADYGESVYGL